MKVLHAKSKINRLRGKYIYWITRLQPPCQVLPPSRCRIFHIRITMHPRARETFLCFEGERSASMEKVRTFFNETSTSVEFRSIRAAVGVEQGSASYLFCECQQSKSLSLILRNCNQNLAFTAIWSNVEDELRSFSGCETPLFNLRTPPWKIVSFSLVLLKEEDSISCYNPGDLKWLTNEPLTFNTGTSLLSNLQEMLQRDSLCPQKYERARDVKRLKPTDLVNSLVLSDCSISEWYQRGSERSDVAALPHRETGWNQMQPVLQRIEHASHTCPHCAHLIDTRLQS